MHATKPHHLYLFHSFILMECKYLIAGVITITITITLMNFVVEELQCLAQWKEGSHHYLLGKMRLDHRTITSNEEAYRCFIYEKTKSNHVGYNVAISGDASCAGVVSPTEGAKALVLTKGEFREEVFVLQ